MESKNEYLAILRCQTWNVWPEKTGSKYDSFFIDYGELEKLSARLIVVSYDKRTSAERFVNEETKIGPLMWDGEIYGLHKVRNTILKAPKDKVEVSMVHRNAQLGEIDIFINFFFTEGIPSSLIEALRATAYSILSLLNLKLNDFLIPTLPFQIRKVLSDGDGQLESSILIDVNDRKEISSNTIESTLTSIANVLIKSSYGVKLRTALELYAAHFTEQQVRVRFLLLVIALESLTNPTKKHNVAVNLMSRWQQELKIEIKNYSEKSEEFKSLESLSRELNFRTEDSLRSQIRKLFKNLNSCNSEEMQRRALHVYDKRSTLVHEGELPDEELVNLEAEAKELLVTLFLAAIDQQPD